jgi:SPP1 gp7 family putative phage head morphogenesis protein
MKNSEYWQKRFELLEVSQINKGIEFNHDLKKQYEIAKAYIQGRIADFYMRFAENNELDNLADAKKLLKKDELEEFKWTVYEYIDNAKAHGADKDWIKKLENASIKARVSRLEYIKMQIQQQAELLTALKAEGVKKLLTDVYYDKYIKTAYEISKGLGVGFEVYGLNTETVKKIITKPWAPDGSNFSKRIWGSHRAQLINSLKTQLSQSIIRGNGPKEAIEIISKLFDVDYNKASNLVQTELAFFSSAAQKDMFDELNVEKYEIVATLDLRTSEICQEMDGKIFNEKDYEGGVTAPPFHCRCRSTTCPYFDDEFTIDETRVARDPVTGKTVTVPGNMTYKEWKEKYSKDIPTTQDERQYQRYKSILGKKAPQTLEEFKKIKYNKDEWKLFKAYSSSIKSGELTPLADFDLYKQINKEIDNSIVGLTTSNGIKVTGKSNHFVARVIGSVEQKRNGVLVEDVYKALISKDAEILPIKDLSNGKSQKIRYNDIEVTINPETGNLIQTNPFKRRKKK